MEDKTTDKKPKVNINRSIAASRNPCGPTCEITHGGQAIRCRICGRESFNPGDVEMRFCGSCKRFHDDDSHY